MSARIDPDLVRRHRRALDDAMELTGQATAEMMASLAGFPPPSTGLADLVLHYGWHAGIGIIADLSPYRVEDRITWLTGGIDSDDHLTEAVVARVRTCPVFHSTAEMESVYRDLARDVVVPDADEMTETEHIENAVLSVLETTAHAAIDAVVSEYRQQMSGKTEDDDHA